MKELRKRLKKAQSLHFDDYSFEGEVEDFGAWVADGADYNVWDLRPLMKDIERIRAQGDCEVLLLDYPFAYCHEAMKPYIDCAVLSRRP